MNGFKASNGMQMVALDTEGRIFELHDEHGANMLEDAPWLGSDDMQALREFFQAEADERLGRWRWPENPEYVVCPRDNGSVTVFEESSPTAALTFWKGVSRPGTSSGKYMDAARAYFDAHPEPKPWHEAVEGEVWALTIGDDTEPRGWMAEGDGPRFWRGGHSIDRLSGSISAGRRIWPEVSA